MRAEEEVNEVSCVQQKRLEARDGNRRRTLALEPLDLARQAGELVELECHVFTRSQKTLVRHGSSLSNTRSPMLAPWPSCPARSSSRTGAGRSPCWRRARRR